jgi:hypothetical protein
MTLCDYKLLFKLIGNLALKRSRVFHHKSVEREKRELYLPIKKTQLYIQAIAKTEILTAGYQNRPKPNKAGRLITIMTTEKKKQKKSNDHSTATQSNIIYDSINMLFCIFEVTWLCYTNQ